MSAKQKSRFSHLNRRDLLVRAAATGAVASLGAPSIVKAQTNELYIGGPGGFESLIREHFFPPFEAAYNCKVNYDGSQSMQNLQKLQASREEPVFDVVMMDDPIMLIAEKDSLLERLTPASVPNMTKLVPNAVPRDGMWVNHMWPQLSVAYYTPEIDDVESWAMLWEPQYAERVLVAHPSSTQGPIPLVVGAHLATGKPYSEAQYDLDAGFAKLAEMKGNLLDAYPGSAQAAPLLEQGEAWLAVGFFSSYVFPRRDAGAPVDLASPKEGSFALPMGMAKVDRARNPELANAWINECLGNDFQTIWTEKFFGSPTNREVAINPSIVPAEELFALDWTFFSERLQEIIDRFDREIMG